MEHTTFKIIRCGDLRLLPSQLSTTHQGAAPRRTDLLMAVPPETLPAGQRTASALPPPSSRDSTLQDADGSPAHRAVLGTQRPRLWDSGSLPPSFLV